METKLDIPYSATERAVRVLDLFLPGDNANGCAIFFVHGGGWHAGEKKGWRPVAMHFASLGYVCTSAEYHLAPDGKLANQAADLRIAMSFVKSHAAEWGFDPARVAALGSSAGAHLVALLATILPDDPLGLTPEVTVRDTRPALAVCFNSIFSMHEADQAKASLTDAIRDVLGATEADDPDAYRQASPLDRITGAEPPFLMIVGDADDLTPIAGHEVMRDALVAAGVAVEMVVLPGVNHGFGYGVTSDAQKTAHTHVARHLGALFGLAD